MKKSDGHPRKDLDGHLESFLLGRLPEEERDRVEQEVLADDEAFGRLESAEEDLIDAYARGELAPAERRELERSSLGSERNRARVAFAKHLAAVTARRPAAAAGAEERRGVRPFGDFWRRLWAPRPRQAWAFAMALLIVAGLGLASWRLGRHFLAPDGESAVVVTFGLTLGSRETGVPQLAVPENADTVVLEIAYDGEYRSLDARLTANAGDETWSRRGISPRSADWGEYARVEVPAGVLPPGRYVLDLQGVDTAGRREEIGIYDFEVTAP